MACKSFIHKYAFGALAAVMMAAGAAPMVFGADDGRLFAYPDVPENKNILSERCNYLVYHFWDRANLTTAFSSRQKLHNALGDWFGFMPYATADTVHLAIDRLIEKVGKSGPNTLTLAQMAEAWVYSDTSEIRSEELYLPFAKAAAGHKKISKAERQRFAAQAKVIETSGLNASLPAGLRFKGRDGRSMSIGDIKGESILLGFVDPTCGDCTLDMVRLSADPNVRDLTASGEMTIVMLYGDEPDSQWEAKAATLPESWIVGAMPDADEYFDLSVTPSYYFLGSGYKIVAKQLVIDQILAAAAGVNSRRSREKK